MNTLPDIGALGMDRRIRYALLAAGVQTGLVNPATAAGEIIADLQAAGVDLRGGIATWRAALVTATGQHSAIIDAIEALLPPETAPAGAGPSRPRAKASDLRITVRQIGK